MSGRHIFRHGHFGSDAGGVAVFGNGCKTKIPALTHCRARDIASGQFDAAAGYIAHPSDRLGHLTLAVAFYAGDSNDFTRAHREVDLIHGPVAAIVIDLRSEEHTS